MTTLDGYESLGAAVQTKIGSIRKCNIMLRVVYGNPFPGKEKKHVGIFKVLANEKGRRLSKQNRETYKERNAVLALPAIRDDSVHPLSGVVDAELSGLFLGRWSADVACPGDRLVFSWRCAVGTVSNASIIESSHNRVEAIVW